MMAAPGVRHDFQKRRFGKAFADFVFRDGRFALRMDAHASRPKRFQRLLDFAVLLHTALNKDPIRFLDIAFFKLEA